MRSRRREGGLWCALFRTTAAARGFREKEIVCQLASIPLSQLDDERHRRQFWAAASAELDRHCPALSEEMRGRIVRQLARRVAPVAEAAPSSDSDSPSDLPRFRKIKRGG